MRVYTKDSILRGGRGKDARRASWGKHVTRALFQMFRRDPEKSRRVFGIVNREYEWSFEIANPRTNHDFIKYKNKETFYCEYTGTMTPKMVEALRDYLADYVEILASRDVIIPLDRFQQAFRDEFKDVIIFFNDQNFNARNRHNISSGDLFSSIESLTNETSSSWDQKDSVDQKDSLDQKDTDEKDGVLIFPGDVEDDKRNLRKNHKLLSRAQQRLKKEDRLKRKKQYRLQKRRKLDKKDLKKRLGDFIERHVRSVVDNVSPVEGVVFRVSGREYKLQTNTYLRLQRGQMPLYSLLKLGHKEKKILMKYPKVPISALQKHFKKSNFHPVIDKNQSLSLVETLKRFLTKGEKDNKTFEKSMYRVWFTSKEAKRLKKHASRHPVKVFKILHKTVKGKNF
jgi:hypothetical protein